MYSKFIQRNHKNVQCNSACPSIVAAIWIQWLHRRRFRFRSALSIVSPMKEIIRRSRSVAPVGEWHSGTQGGYRLMCDTNRVLISIHAVDGTE
jgi:hypothetical protein